ncbi:methionyl-tRNA formyltransferase [Thiopseudomonas acetoxidans]|uniref:Methionyl-tRNA formyltransferase n=1 Tax=Thiopseudomonas acetoxidans TaxID=3041622 RepID=A0ABT7SND3_9GAMM|nr:methionyl-tRNA formyltransferase [Thiopseudomonas sp. CY1220]MDM7857697.1 methionyl-tRNA formyltransferase [Thiopseudomonas sp. CY1220]
MSDSARIVFAGTPEFAAQHLQALLDSQHKVVSVYTQPDRPAGRGQKLVASPVKQLALAHDIPVLQPQNLRTEEAQATLAEFKADLMVVVAYGLILPQAILDTPRLGCINSHASLLPRWRGAAPIQRAIEAGDAETGVTVMQMEAGLDTGPMLLKVATPIAASDTGGSLHDRLASMGPPAVLETVAQLLAGTAQPVIQQNELATYAHKLSKGCAFIDWQQPAQVIERAVRAFHPWPISHTLLGETSIKVHAAQVVEQQGTPGSILQVSREGLLVACGQDALLITQMQLPNAKALAFADIYNGRADLFTLGQVLGA